MDLLAYLKKEVESLQLTDQLSIARFIYIKTGELFEYDRAYTRSLENSKVRKRISDKVIDIHNVTDFHAICTSWSKMYVELLKEFDIDAMVMSSDYGRHTYVEIFINEQIVIADLMLLHQDITGIKFGFRTNYFRLEQGNFSFDIDKKINYFKGIYPDEVLSMIKSELNLDNYESESEKANKVFEVIQTIINIERPYVSFNSGFYYIKGLLHYFRKETDAYVGYTDLYNHEKTEFLGVFANFSGKIPIYYVYRKDNNGFYKLEEATIDMIENLVECYECYLVDALRLRK